MGNFSVYADRVSDLAAATFKEYFSAAEELERAEAQKNRTPILYNVPADAKYHAESYEAAARYERANTTLAQIKRRFDERRSQLRQIRNELAADVDKNVVARTADLDMETITLMNSGILTAHEFKLLAEKAASANNDTMVRIIAQKAMEIAASEGANGNQDKAKEYRAVHHVASAGLKDAAYYMDAFGSLERLFERCLNNPPLYNHWDELSQNAREALRG